MANSNALENTIANKAAKYNQNLKNSSVPFSKWAKPEGGSPFENSSENLEGGSVFDADGWQAQLKKIKLNVVLKWLGAKVEGTFPNLTYTLDVAGDPPSELSGIFERGGLKTDKFSYPLSPFKLTQIVKNVSANIASELLKEEFSSKPEAFTQYILKSSAEEKIESKTPLQSEKSWAAQLSKIKLSFVLTVLGAQKKGEFPNIEYSVVTPNGDVLVGQYDKGLFKTETESIPPLDLTKKVLGFETNEQASAWLEEKLGHNAKAFTEYFYTPTQKNEVQNEEKEQNTEVLFNLPKVCAEDWKSGGRFFNSIDITMVLERLGLRPLLDPQNPQNVHYKALDTEMVVTVSNDRKEAFLPNRTGYKTLELVGYIKGIDSVQAANWLVSQQQWRLAPNTTAPVLEEQDTKPAVVKHNIDASEHQSKQENASSSDQQHEKSGSSSSKGVEDEKVQLCNRIKQEALFSYLGITKNERLSTEDTTVYLLPIPTEQSNYTTVTTQDKFSYFIAGQDKAIYPMTLAGLVLSQTHGNKFSYKDTVELLYEFFKDRDVDLKSKSINKMDKEERNAYFKAKREALAQKVINIPVRTVLDALGASGNEDRNRKKWKLEGFGNISLRGDTDWFNHNTEKGGVGCISLVEKYFQFEYSSQAVEWLANTFGESVSDEDIVNAKKRIASDAPFKEKKHYVAPPREDRYLPFAIKYLKFTRGIPEPLISRLIEEKTLYMSDKKRIVFLAPGFKYSDERSPFNGPNAKKECTPGSVREAGYLIAPLLQEGEVNPKILGITEAPIEAMSYHALYPNRAALSCAGAKWEQGMINCLRALEGGYVPKIGYNNDSAGELGAQDTFNAVYLTKFFMKNFGLSSELAEYIVQKDVLSLLSMEQFEAFESGINLQDKGRIGFFNYPEEVNWEAGGPEIRFLLKPSNLEKTEFKLSEYPIDLNKLERAEDGKGYVVKVQKQAWDYFCQIGFVRERPKSLYNDWNDQIVAEPIQTEYDWKSKKESQKNVKPKNSVSP